MKKLMVLAAASFLAISAASPAHAKKLLITEGSSMVTGQWLVGSIAVPAFSLITCAAIANKKFGRALTQQEAWLAAALPFSCLYLPPR